MPEVIDIFDVGDYESVIARGAEILRGGGLVVLPTETVYGAAGLLTQSQGNTRLRQLRGNGATGKSFTIHLAHPQNALRLIGGVSELGKRMMRKLWPGPVALVFEVPAERRAQVAAELKLPESDLYDGSRITLRCPDHPIATEILRNVDGPVALTRVESENWSDLDGKVDLIFDAGPSTFSKPSTIVRVLDGGYEIVREGVYDRRIIERLLQTTILFVCSGNTCRSPMAEGIARKKIAGKLGVSEEDLEKKKGIIVLSAGSFAMPGARATPQGVEAARDLDVDLSKHRSRTLSVELIHQADWIFTMGRSHAAAVRVLVPSAAEKTSTLNPDGDIEDPIGGNVELYRSLARQLSELIDRQVMEKINGQ